MLKWLRGKGGADAPGDAPAAPPAPAAAAPAADPDELMRRAFPLHQAGDVAAAQRLYREILEIDPKYADAHYLLGRIEHEEGRHEEAIPHLRNALRADNKNPHFHRTLGDSFMALGHWLEALAYFQNAAELDPGDFEHWNNLGCANEKLGRLNEASQHFDKAFALEPRSPPVLNNVAMTLKERGRIDEALVRYRQLRELAPDNDVFFSNYLFTLVFSTAHTPEDVCREHSAYDDHFGVGRHGRRMPAGVDRTPGRRLRIGYLSPDLRSHAVAVFLEGVLAHHDASAVEIFCFHLWPRRDRVSERIKLLTDHWIECAGLDAAALAQRIEAQHIDVLVDLAGHTGDNGLAAVGLKPAPVIAAWLGYPATTGLKTVDYRITDAVCDPPGAERYHTEKVYRLPGAQWCYERPPLDVAVTPLPCAGDGHVRFASFNNAAKLTDEMLRTWARLLERVGNASLLVWGVTDEQADHIRALMRSAGIDAARLEFSPRTAFDAQLAMHQRTDIALDTFPYGGVTTTLNSLWMGVPVLTRAGQASSSRTSLSILTALGLQDWCAATPDELVEIAVAKLADGAALARLRAELRERLVASPLMDGPAFARKLEAAYRDMWTAYCTGAGPG